MLKMKFFATVPSSNERAPTEFGLARLRRCFTLGSGLLRIHHSEVNELHIEQPQASSDENSTARGNFLSLKRIRAVGWTSVLFALLQSLCTAVLTISGIRVAIGFSALAAASGIYAPATGWHQDAIRIPMLILATVGALINLAVIGWMRRLRNRPSARWRRGEPSAKQKRSVRLQIAMAIMTLILVGLETWTHPIVHRKGPPPPCRVVGNCI